MALQVLVPDVGDAAEVEIIEILVSVGDVIAKDDSLVVLESDKASMEIPTPEGGKVVSIAVKEGDIVDEGTLIIELEIATAVEPAMQSAANEKNTPKTVSDESQEVMAAQESDQVSPVQASSAPKEQIIAVPDVGGADEVLVTDVLVKVGDALEAEDSLVVLESDKASMEIPTPVAGEVLEILVEEGAEVKEGDALVRLMAADQTSDPSETASAPAVSAATVEAVPLKPVSTPAAPQPVATLASSLETSALVHAGPAVRKQAREYGVDLGEVIPSGQKSRILKEDIQNFVKQRLSEPSSKSSADAVSGGIPPIPDVDFSRFGVTEMVQLSRIRKASAKNLHRSWVNVPHVTQFDEADITELEAFRKSQNIELAKTGNKITPLAFLVKACVNALIKYPQFNASIESSFDHMVYKKYYNIGVAVETPDGLVVPVIKDADKKGVIQLAQETAELAALAREKKLPMDAMQGGTFSISSLGGIGGTAFTPIVNAPEVAILGVSKSKMAPVYDGIEFQPRNILPLSLSYDHRAIDGAEAARFTAHIAQVLSDLKRLIL
jgi:pyruvate dehydrogenase E2 component (dihydrolipoamide acetyltransferase)